MIERLRSGGLRRLVRYLGTGGVLAGMDYLVFSLLLLLGTAPGLAQMVARTAGACAGFVLQRMLVFKDAASNAAVIARQGAWYFALAVFNILLSGWLVGLLSTATPLPAVFIKFMIDILLVIQTYVLLHFIFQGVHPV